MKEEKEEAASVGKRVQYGCYDEIIKKLGLCLIYQKTYL
jgi:hypothetical protein